MAINKKLIHFSKGENYDIQKNNSNILDSSICFIQDRKTIITHGTEYKAIGWSELLPPPVIKGVTIVDLQGEQHLVSEWTGGSNATGVALINDNISIIIAPKNWYAANGSNYDGAWNGNTKSAWGGYDKTVTGIKTTTSRSDALTDFAGSPNTDAIIFQLKGTTDNHSYFYTGAPAAEYCRAYSNGCKGAGQWYLPAAGEMNQIVLNRVAIEEALTAISGELFSSPGHEWTSTQYNSDDTWCYFWALECFDAITKSTANGVRPICAF